ncbi:hypothetical protein [[Flexibacter] sp. ATCC 35103]|uniref:hypothetical protein n=1 Tax=[Flexibacter] sp. ATCC 35103 TaxID=1937528 RepID=UPI0009CFC402|nr:hypothetical protein [[Flexibacter] sp. ATCC 35103]OMQ08191.1 hypothetical protein BXU01_22085 [[Flexibacter] sp. ATCC 35103]
MHQKVNFKKLILVDALPASASLMISNYKGDIIAYDNPQSKMMLSVDQKTFNPMNFNYFNSKLEWLLFFRPFQI